MRRLHQGGADAFPEERLEIEDQAIAEADGIIAECPQDREDLIGLYGADAGRIRTIPCGYDAQEFGPMDKKRARALLGLKASERIILQLGRMVPRKGVDTAIRALACLQRTHGTRARLLIVGGESRTPDPVQTPELGRLQGVARAEGVAEDVVFVGSRRRQELRNYYCAADVFVTTPWYEPFGITPVEAMACGTPVVGSAVGGIKSTVQDGETGYLVPPNDPAALAERLARLYSRPEVLADFGRRARRRAELLFTWDRVAGAVTEFYDDVEAGVMAASAGSADAPLTEVGTLVRTSLSPTMGYGS